MSQIIKSTRLYKLHNQTNSSVSLALGFALKAFDGFEEVMFVAELCLGYCDWLNNSNQLKKSLINLFNWKFKNIISQALIRIDSEKYGIYLFRTNYFSRPTSNLNTKYIHAYDYLLRKPNIPYLISTTIDSGIMFTSLIGSSYITDLRQSEVILTRDQISSIRSKAILTLIQTIKHIITSEELISLRPLGYKNSKEIKTDLIKLMKLDVSFRQTVVSASNLIKLVAGLTELINERNEDKLV